MELYTNSEQTAKLIELGLPRPKGWCVKGISSRLQMYKHKEDNEDFNYSIGELIEMLPEAICKSNDDSYHYFLSIETDSLIWKVFYESEDEVTLCSTFGVELVDALCSMVTMLKRRGTL